ncbi:MAG: hypothetical protein AUK44_09715 [Porphyromonadaceae bacterium CG2_30_38_12]|nr:MAG: hypothetical protein AUK44_09715 [Porphyromonadaceae bacterium CG2_30_38_12]
MKFYPVKVLLFVWISAFYTSCTLLDTTPVVVSTNANFVSLTFAASQTADANVSKAFFTVAEYDAQTKDSIIVNLDSLPYRTSIEKVIPTFRFNSTAGTYVHRVDSLGAFRDSIGLTGKDTLDFRRVVKVTNIASDKLTRVSYRIKVNVHQVEPELYQWNKVVSQLTSDMGLIHKAVMLHDSVFLFNATNGSIALYKSKDAIQWDSKIMVSNLPADAPLRNMVVFNNKIFLVYNDTLLYWTADGVTWTKGEFSTEAYLFKNLLFGFRDKLWAITQTKTDSKYHFARSSTGASWEILSQELPANFPVREYAALAFVSRVNYPKVLVAGGFNKEGALLSNVWSSEDGINWFDFSTENKTFGVRSASSIVAYDNKLLVFGGFKANNQFCDSLYMESADEGLSWKVPDTLTNRIRKPIYTITATKADTTYLTYEKRAAQSVLVDNNQNLILIGGVNNEPNPFADVWKGRLNKLVFIRQ